MSSKNNFTYNAFKKHKESNIIEKVWKTLQKFYLLTTVDCSFDYFFYFIMKSVRIKF